MWTCLHLVFIVIQTGLYTSTHAQCQDDQYKDDIGSCIPCPEKCLQCSSSDQCDRCEEGYYGDKCEYRCRVNCATCASTGTCFTCIQGFFNDICGLPCPDQCVNRTCHILTGLCKCMDGFYSYRNSTNGIYTCLKCPLNCRSCTSVDSCQTCNPGFYGLACHLPCSNKCEQCTHEDTCQSCKAGYFGPSCQSNCSEQCADIKCGVNGACKCADHYFIDSYTVSKVQGELYTCCPDTCNACATANSCVSCKTGYFGIICNETCRNCVNNTCRKLDGRCTVGCNHGYYQEAIGCTKCLSNCVSCVSASECSACRPGHYGAACQHDCQNCLTCNSEGKCFGCQTGHYGQYCTSKCSLRCRDGCDQQSGECRSCIAGHLKVGTECLTCPSGCYKCLSTDSCVKCQSGYFPVQDQSHCDACPDNCELCYTKETCINCKQGYAKVDGLCISCMNCADVDACMMGDCTGCAEDNYGHFCEFSCNENCMLSFDMNSSCWQYNGSCKVGCREGFTGENCTYSVVPALDTTISITVILVSAISVVFFIIMVVTFGCLIKRKRMRKVSKSLQKDHVVPGLPMARQVDAGQLSAGQVDAGQTSAGQVVAGQFSAGQVDAGQFSTGQVVAGQFSAGQVDAGQISRFPSIMINASDSYFDPLAIMSDECTD